MDRNPDWKVFLNIFSALLRKLNCNEKSKVNLYIYIRNTNTKKFSLYKNYKQHKKFFFSFNGCTRVLPFSFFNNRTRRRHGEESENITEFKNSWPETLRFFQFPLSLSRRSHLALLLLFLLSSSASAKYALTYFTVFPFWPLLGIWVFLGGRCFNFILFFNYILLSKL